MMYSRFKSELDIKNERRRRTAQKIMKMEDDKARHEALVEFIKTEHTEKCRWSVEAIADIAEEYIDCKRYDDFCEDELGEDNRFAGGQVSVLERLLLRNGWGWVVDLR